MSVMGFNAGLALQAALVSEKAAIAASNLARRVGIDQLDTKYDLDGLVAGPTIFSATGVTQGSLLDSVKMHEDRVYTHTLIMNSVDGSVQRLRSDRPVKG